MTRIVSKKKQKKTLVKDTRSLQCTGHAIEVEVSGPGIEQGVRLMCEVKVLDQGVRVEMQCRVDVWSRAGC